MQTLRFYIFSALTFAVSSAVAEEELSWRFIPGDGFGAAILTNCSECDYIEMVVNCAEGSGEVEMAIVIDVENGNPGEPRNVTFLFGDGAIDRPSVLVANELDGTTEPSVMLSADDELLEQIRLFVPEPQTAASEAQKKAAASSMEVLVENGPAKVFSLNNAGEALAEFIPVCRKGG